MIQNFSNIQTVLFSDGVIGRKAVFIYEGACMVGDPTAYVFRNGNMVWVKRGESAAWIEA